LRVFMAISVGAGIWLRIVLVVQQVAGHLQERNWQFSKEFRDDLEARVCDTDKSLGELTFPS